MIAIIPENLEASNHVEVKVHSRTFLTSCGIPCVAPTQEGDGSIFDRQIQRKNLQDSTITESGLIEIASPISSV